MENEKSVSPIFIVVLLVLGICLVGFCVWHGLSYFNGQEVESPTSNEETENREDTSELTDVQVKAYSALITKDKSYGFYFNKSVSIDNITDFSMIKYVLNNYVQENNISLESDLTCLDIKKDYCKNITFPSVSNAKINEYIKNSFNTTRNFKLTQNNIPEQYIDAEDNITIALYNGFCNYDFSKEIYYFGSVATGGMYRKVYTKLSKAEEDGDKLYFYDKAFIKEVGQGYISIMNYLSDETSSTDNEIFSYDTESAKKYDEIKVTVKNGNNLYDINAGYIFDKYSDKLNSYKHTFKKVDGNYYWVSSEIIK